MPSPLSFSRHCSTPIFAVFYAILLKTNRTKTSCTFVALHIDSKLVLLLPIPGESSVPWFCPPPPPQKNNNNNNKARPTFVLLSACRVCQSVLSIALHNRGPLPPAPQRMALCLPQAIPEGPVEMIGRFLWSSLLIDSQLQRVWSIGVQMAKIQSTVSLPWTMLAYGNRIHDV